MNAATRQLRNDRQRVMVTPEGIALPVVLASRGARFGALMIDLILIGLAMILATVAIGLLAGGTAKLGFEADQAKGAARHALDFLFILWVAAIFLFRNAYFLFFELGPRGAPIKAAEQIEQRGFAATGRPHDADVFAGLNAERNAAQCFHRHRTHLVGFPDVFELNDG